LAYGRAAWRLDAEQAERIMLQRLARSIAARESLEAAVQLLGQIRSQESLTLLLAAAEQPHVAASDRARIAWALGRLRDDRGVAVLVAWLVDGDYRLKDPALAALEQIDSPLAAREARGLLKLEAHLPYKLRLARLLARHGIADGYALATEHLSDAKQTAAATLVLVALNDPRTERDLSNILAARPDRRWHAAALTGLAAIGNEQARAELLAILSDDRHPLAADAAEAAGLAADSQLLAPLGNLVRSRNQHIALSALVALRRFYSGVRSSPEGLGAIERPAETMGAIGGAAERDLKLPAADVPADTEQRLAEAAASMARDAYVDAEVRRQALDVVRLVGAEMYEELLAELADQAELEGTQLLAEVQAERRGGD
jgi:hypothetical protein